MCTPVYVIGHRNPDTDATTSAAGYAAFLNDIGRYDGEALATAPGPLTPQAKWVFEQSGITPPTVIESFAPRVRDVTHFDPTFLTGETRLGSAIDTLIRSGHSMLPVIDAEGRFSSVFSNREDISRFLMNLDVVPLAASLLNWQDIVATPGMQTLGDISSTTEIGSLLITLAGDETWISTAQADDLLICGNAELAHRVPAERRPTRIVVVSPNVPDSQAISEFNKQGLHLLHYPGGVSDLLKSLTNQVRIGSLDLGHGACLGPEDLLTDVSPLIESSRRALPVIDSDGKLAGVVARSDLKSSPKRRAVLVDHFESSQAVHGVEHLDLLEVVDHHRIGNIETDSPIRVDCRPIGSSASIVALNYFEAGREPDKAVATLLLGGLCADTLALHGPTATTIDHHVASRLAKIAEVNLEHFGIEVLRAGDDLLTAEPTEIWNRDQKLFGIRNQQFAVAQLETVDLANLPAERLDAFRDQLSKDFESGNYLSSVLVVTDVLRRESWITGFESPSVHGALCTAFGDDAPRPEWIEAREIVSRKKQIIPRLMQTYSQLSL